MPPPRELIDHALRVTGLTLGELAAQLGLKEATLYKARGGHIALSTPARQAIAHLLASKTGAAEALSVSVLRRSSPKPASLQPLLDQLAFIQQHATPDERQILADTLAAFHRRIAERRRKNPGKQQKKVINPAGKSPSRGIS